jgi:hypothetical protein
MCARARRSMMSRSGDRPHAGSAGRAGTDTGFWRSRRIHRPRHAAGGVQRQCRGALRARLEARGFWGYSSLKPLGPNVLSCGHGAPQNLASRVYASRDHRRHHRSRAARGTRCSADLRRFGGAAPPPRPRSSSWAPLSITTASITGRILPQSRGSGRCATSRLAPRSPAIGGAPTCARPCLTTRGDVPTSTVSPESATPAPTT